MRLWIAILVTTAVVQKVNYNVRVMHMPMGDCPCFAFNGGKAIARDVTLSFESERQRCAGAILYHPLVRRSTLQSTLQSILVTCVNLQPVQLDQCLDRFTIGGYARGCGRIERFRESDEDFASSSNGSTYLSAILKLAPPG